MTSKEFRRQQEEIARRKELAAKLVAIKAERDEAAARTRAARSSARWAMQYQSLDRLPVIEPQAQWSGSFGGLRPTLSAYEVDRRARKADEILEEWGIR